MAVSFQKIEERLKTEARRLLESGQVSLVLAWGRGYDENHPIPYVVKGASDVDGIVFNEFCTHNLARYLVRYPRGTKIAIAVKAADSRAVVQLIQEDKVKRDDLVILGIPVSGIKNPKTGEIIDDKTTCDTIREVYEQNEYLLDPHTAIGVRAARNCRRDSAVPMITLGTAHPAKFPDAIAESGLSVKPQLPAHMADLFEREERYTVLDNNVSEVQGFIAKHWKNA